MAAEAQYVTSLRGKRERACQTQLHNSRDMVTTGSSNPLKVLGKISY